LRLLSRVIPTDPTLPIACLCSNFPDPFTAIYCAQSHKKQINLVTSLFCIGCCFDASLTCITLVNNIKDADCFVIGMTCYLLAQSLVFTFHVDVYGSECDHHDATADVIRMLFCMRCSATLVDRIRNHLALAAWMFFLLRVYYAWRASTHTDNGARRTNGIFRGQLRVAICRERQVIGNKLPRLCHLWATST